MMLDTPYSDCLRCAPAVSSRSARQGLAGARRHMHLTPSSTTTKPFCQSLFARCTMAFEPLLEEETSILASAVEACLALTLPDAGFDEALVALMRAFYSTTLSRKAIYERLRRVKPLPFEVRPSDLSRLEARRLVLVVTQAPPTVVPTPLGLYSLYVSRQPRERDRQLESLLSSLESEAERKLRLTLHTFVEAPLSDKEAGSVIFLLYNDSTAPAR